MYLEKPLHLFLHQIESTKLIHLSRWEKQTLMISCLKMFLINSHKWNVNLFKNYLERLFDLTLLLVSFKFVWTSKICALISIDWYDNLFRFFPLIQRFPKNHFKFTSIFSYTSLFEWHLRVEFIISINIIRNSFRNFEKVH